MCGLCLFHGITHLADTQNAAGEPAGTNETALEILKKRYARGEISKAMYEQLQKDLS